MACFNFEACATTGSLLNVLAFFTACPKGPSWVIVGILGWSAVHGRFCALLILQGLIRSVWDKGARVQPGVSSVVDCSSVPDRVTVAGGYHKLGSLCNCFCFAAIHVILESAAWEARGCIAGGLWFVCALGHLPHFFIK